MTSRLPIREPRGGPLSDQLRRAAGRGNISEARDCLARGANPNARDGIGWSSVHHAAFARHAETLRLLIGGGGRVLAETPEGVNAVEISRLHSRRNSHVVRMMEAAAARERAHEA